MANAHALIRIVLATAVASSAGYGVLQAQSGGITQIRLGPSSAVSSGALRCNVNDRPQLVIEAIDTSRRAVDLTSYQVQVGSSNPRTVSAMRHLGNEVWVICAADGQSELTVQAGGASTCMPVLVGTSKNLPPPPCAAAQATQQPRQPPIQAALPSGRMPATRAPVAQRPGTRPEAVSAATPTPTAQNAPLRPIVATAAYAAVPAANMRAIAGYGNVQVVWSPAPGAVGYRIARKRVSTNEMVNLAGNQVTPSGGGLVTDTMYFDMTAVANEQYVYYLATYFRSPDGSYYFPPAESEGRVLAVPREASGRPWLPSDWQAPPKITRGELVNNTTAEGGSFLLEWVAKGGATGYLVRTIAIDMGEWYEDHAREHMQCIGQSSLMVAPPPVPGRPLLSFGTRLEGLIPRTIPGVIVFNASGTAMSTRTEAFCVSVSAVYPDAADPATGTPVISAAFSDPDPAKLQGYLFKSVVSRPAVFIIRWVVEFDSSGKPKSPTRWEVAPQNQIVQP